MTLFRRLVLTGLLVFVASSAHANTGEIYGFGSRASSLGNTMMGGSNDGFATYYNPAANSSNEGFHLSYGLTYDQPSFKEIRNVVISNGATSGDPVVYGTVDTEYLAHFGQFLGASINFGEKLKNLTVGFTGYLPVERVIYLDSGDVFKPEYYNYRSRTQRPQMYFSLSAKPLPRLSLAAGLTIATNLSAKASFQLSTANNTVSYGRFSSTIKPTTSYYFSAYTDPKPFQFGLTVRLPTKYKLSIDTTANAQILGPASGLPLSTTALSTFYYDPFEIDLAGSLQATENTWFTLEVDWLNYKAFDSPSMMLANGGTVGGPGGTPLKPSISNLPAMRNIFVPKVGVEHVFGVTTGRLGYFYRMSPVIDNNGPGNLIDPSQHVFTAGFGVDLKKAKVTERDIHLDLHVQYHWLVKRSIVKSPGDEVGSISQPKLGSPGFDEGGSIYGGGFTLSMAF